MVEGGACPIGRAVTGLTSRREIRLHVIRVRRAFEIGLVALLATRGSGQVIGPGRIECCVVTLRALQRYVRTGEGEPGGRVVKRAAGPVCGVMALLTSRREPRLDVIRVCRAIEVRLMALHALRVIGQIVGPTGAEGRVVTLRTLQRGVGAGQREASGRVIEVGAGPTRGVVALRAVLRKARLHVVRSRGAGEVLLVARVAGRAIR